MNIHLEVCIKMTMLRPSGKAFKIAQKVIPGFDRNRSSKKTLSSKKELPKDDVELKIVNDNEQAIIV